MMHHPRIVFAVASLALVVTGCGEDKSAAKPAAVAPPGGAGSGVLGVEDPATASAAAAAARPRVPGVPDLDLGVVSSGEHSKARNHNGRALRHHKKKSWDAAISEYITGLSQNPGHILQRYNLGCAYAMNGEHDKALGILKQFAYESDCILCQGRLKRAVTDKDFESMWSDPEFVALTRGVNPAQPNYKKITQRFLKHMGTAYWGLMKRTVDNGYAFAVSVSKPRGHDGWLITDGSELARWKISLGAKKAIMLPGENNASTIKCRGACCTVKTDASPLGGQVATIQSICYWPVSESEAYVRRVKLAMHQ